MKIFNNRFLTGTRIYILIATALGQAVFAMTPFLLRRVGLSEGELGLVIGVFALGQFIAVPAFGLLVDHQQERRLLTVGAIFLLLSGVPLLFGGFIGWMLHRLLLGVGAGGVVVCLAAAAKMNGGQDRARGIAGIISFGLVGTIIGLLLPTLVPDGFSAIVFVAVQSIVVLGLLIAVRRMDDRAFAPPTAGSRLTLTLLISLLVSFLTAAAFLGFYTQAVIRLAELTQDVTTNGLILAGATLLATIGALVFRSRRARMDNEGVATAVVLAVAAAVFLLPIWKFTTAPLFLVLGLYTYLGFLTDTFVGALQTRLTPKFTGGALALGMTAASLGRFAGPSINTAVPSPTLFSAGLALGGALLALIVYFRLNAELKNDRASS